MVINPEQFTSYQQMLETAQAIIKPQESEEVLQARLKEQEIRRSKMYIITSPSGNYTLQSLVEALKKGDIDYMGGGSAAQWHNRVYEKPSMQALSLFYLCLLPLKATFHTL